MAAVAAAGADVAVGDVELREEAAAPLAELKHHTQSERLAFREDGMLAIALSKLTSSYWVGGVSLASVDGEQQALWSDESGHSDVAWMKGGERLATASDDGDIHVHRVSTVEEASAAAAASGHGGGGDFDDDDDELDAEALAAAGGDELPARRVPPPPPPAIGGGLPLCLTTVATLPEHDDVVTAVTVRASDGLLASASHDGFLLLWGDLLSRRATCRLGKAGLLWDAAWSPSDDALLASASQDGQLRVWDVRAGTVAFRQQLAVAATALAWRSDGHAVAVGGEDGKVGVLDVRSGGDAAALHSSAAQHDGAVHVVAWAPGSSSLLASGGDDGRVLLSNVAVPDSSSRLLGKHADYVRGLAWAPCGDGDDAKLVSSGWDGVVRYWKADA
eukprot:PLAT9506.3.p2 GENE.PLAT9506.3~~PLAT9506.3.p2  ORF type:complete len:389 (-),score=209.38 PLAT9506.3:1404-2570(-)